MICKHFWLNGFEALLYTARVMMTKSLEDYLEAIHRQIAETGVARVVDVAHILGVKMPSVNNAVKELAKLGFVEYERYKEIKITDEGRRQAALIFKRHTLLKSFLLSIGVSEVNAEKDACSMEHILSAETLDRLKSATVKKRKTASDNSGKSS